MKKTLAIIMALTFCLALAPGVFAEETGDAVSHVYVEVVPVIAVGVIDGNVDLGEVQSGEFSGEITFRVDANMQRVTLMPSVSKLFKGDDPSDPDAVGALDVVTDAGVTIEIENGNPTGGASNVAGTPTGAEVNGFPGYDFDDIEFDSAQNGHFSQDVTLTMTWNQSDPEQVMGEYSGFVKLYAMLIPS